MSDCKLAVAATAMGSCSSKLSRDCRRELSLISGRAELTMRYVKAHSGNPFNSLADWLARRASGAETVSFEIGVPWLTIRRRARDGAEQDWMGRWEHGRDCRQAREMIPRIDHELTRWVLSLSRPEASKVVQLLTGHNWLLYHRARIKRLSDNLCRLCGITLETSAHMVWFCPDPALTRIRSNMAVVPGTRPSTAALLAIAKRISHLMKYE